MPATLPPALENVTGALIAALIAVTGRAVGDATAPPQADAAAGYLIVDQIPGGYSDGDIAQPDGTTYRTYQVTAVASTRRQTEWLRDRARWAVLARDANGFTHPIDDYDLNGVTKTLATDQQLRVCDRSFDSDGGVTPEGIVFNAVERYELWVTPA